MSLVGLTSFVVFTWKTPTLAAAKGSYLLPLALPAAVFFVLGVQRVRRWRPMLVSVSAVAALLAAVVFTTDLVFPPAPRGYILVQPSLAPRLPHGHVEEELNRLFAD
jgi:hypothetical protein